MGHNSGSLGCFTSITGFILVLAGLAGIYAYLTEDTAFIPVEVVETAFSYISDMFGSLLIPSIIVSGVGLLLVFGGISGGQQPKKKDDPHAVMVITCPKCGQKNPAYAAVCSNCKHRLSLTET